VSNVYQPEKAEIKASERRKQSNFQGKKIIRFPKLRAYIEGRLFDDYSPEQISGRIRYREPNIPYISKNTIYRFIRSPYGRKIEFHRAIKHLHRRHYKKGKLSERTFIDDRPQIIQERARIGDTEGDFIVSGKGGRGCILTVIDRKTRMIFLEKIFPVSIHNMEKAFLRIKKRFPEMLTLTLDNDLLFAKHLELQRLLGVTIYFCHPYHSWEKGTIENGNGLVRRYIPKRSNISCYTEEEIILIEMKLNDRPRKCLKYMTPKELLLEHRKRSPECSD
ncbi:MAG: transposase, partial [Candidatus Peregrinibacteria bacterium GW2011_GWC2_39_14]